LPFQIKSVQIIVAYGGPTELIADLEMHALQLQSKIKPHNLQENQYKGFIYCKKIQIIKPI